MIRSRLVLPTVVGDRLISAVMAAKEVRILTTTEGTVMRLYKEIYLHEYTTPREARQGIAQYIQFYNTERPHQALAYQRPIEVYQSTVSSIG